MMMLVLLHLIEDGNAEEEVGLKSIMMVKSHGIVMLISWMVLINIGNVFARYLKYPPNKAYKWHPIHIANQSLGMLSSLVGFTLIVLHLYARGDTHFRELHQIMGLLLTLLLIPQPLLGYLRTKKKCRTAHRWLGRVLNLLAILTMALGFIEYFEGMNDKQQQTYVWLCFIASLFITIASYFAFEIYGNPPTPIVKKANTPSVIMIDGSEHGVMPLEEIESPYKVWRNQIIYVVFVLLLLAFVIPIVFTIL